MQKGFSRIELEKRVWREMHKEGFSGRAPQLVYYILLALLPILLFLTI
jgi:uncharacterized BrkB/YihY/UPF0761 family membrane protein